MNSQKEQPIFIVGSERSGTTLLRLILNEHENIALPPQTKFTRKILKRRCFFGNLKKVENRKQITKWILKRSKNTKLNDLKLEPDELYSNMVQRETIGGLLSSIFKMYAQKRNKNRWGDKRPYYIRFIPLLYKCYPDAKIIHLIRDGRDCVSSLKKMSWWNKSTVYSMLNWRYAIRLGKQAHEQFENQFLEVRYEELVNDSENTMRAICAFIGESFSSAMLKFHQNTDDNIPSYKMEWHSQTTRPISNINIGKWKNDLNRKEVQLMEWCAGKELRYWGYLDQKPSIPFLQLPKYFIISFVFYCEIMKNKKIEWFNMIFYRKPLSYIEN